LEENICVLKLYGPVLVKEDPFDANHRVNSPIISMMPT